MRLAPGAAAYRKSTAMSHCVCLLPGSLPYSSLFSFFPSPSLSPHFSPLSSLPLSLIFFFLLIPLLQKAEVMTVCKVACTVSVTGPERMNSSHL